MAVNRLPSVTTVLGLLSKDGLPWAAARETALFAVNHIDEWGTLPAGDAVDRLRKHHRGIWDHRAAVGTVCHAVNESWARGEPVDLHSEIEKVQAETRIWADRTVASLREEIEVMVDGLGRAWKDLQPKTISCEDVVRYPHDTLGYIGQTDWRAVVDGLTYLIDLKTTAELDPTKGYYYETWRLQLAAYRYCTETVNYNERTHRPYAKGIEETGTAPLAPVDRCAVLHVRANGRWEWIPIRAGEREHEHFLALRALYDWLRNEGTRAA